MTIFSIIITVISIGVVGRIVLFLANWLAGLVIIPFLLLGKHNAKNEIKIEEILVRSRNLRMFIFVFSKVLRVLFAVVVWLFFFNLVPYWLVGFTGVGLVLYAIFKK